MPATQARYWIATIPGSEYEFPASLPDGVAYVGGQLEKGETTGFEHWQLIIAFGRKVTLRAVQRVFPGGGHYEPTRSDAARGYCFKEETRIRGPFELGEYLLRRNHVTDWDSIREAAKGGRVDSVPSDIFIRYYRTLRTIACDYAEPVAGEREVVCYYGATGTGKSRRAWAEAGDLAYVKDPRSKFWCGYRGQQNVIIDEFRGGIDISHILRWTDRYPVSVETKGGATPLCASHIWFTSNLHPESWYIDLDQETKNALMRRMRVVEITSPLLEC